MTQAMKKISLIFTFLLCLYACQKAPFLTLNTPSNITFSEQGGSQDIIFQANRNWTASSSESWCKVSPASGNAAEGSNTFKVTCEQNTTYDPRSCTVTIKVEELTEIITVNQETNLGLLVSHASYDLSNKAQTIEIEIQSNSQYEIKPRVDWIHYLNSKGLKPSTITLFIDKNISNDQRTGEVELILNEKWINVIRIKQEGNILRVSQDSFVLSNEAQRLSINVESNIDYSAVSDVDWISVSPDGISSTSLIVNVLQNDSVSIERTGHLILSQTDGTLRTVLTIVQSPFAINPHFNEGIELMCLIFRLAGAPEYNICMVPTIYKSADSFFAQMKNHEAITIARECRSRGVSYDAVTAFGLYLLISENGSISFNPDYVEDSNDSFNRWSDKQKKQMLNAVNDFYRESDFRRWYDTTEPKRQQAIESFKKICTVDFAWYDSFFGPKENSGIQIFLSFLIGLHNHGLAVDLVNGKHLLSPVYGSIHEDNRGAPYYTDILSIIIHEFCHPFCNPLIDEFWDLMEEKANSVLKRVKAQMDAQAYGQSKTMMYETFVRASTIRYLVTHRNNKSKETLIQSEELKGFILVRCLVEALEKREQNPSLYPTMKDFMPEIIKAVNNFQLD